MEQRLQQPDSSVSGLPVEPERGKNKIERIGEQTKGLFDDFTGWVEVRLKLFQLEMQEKIQGKVNEAIIKIAPAVAGALTGLFLLVTIALFIGWWLGHPAWGYLVVTGMLGLVTALLASRARRLNTRAGEKKDRAVSANGSPESGARPALGPKQRA
ncbi:MAG: phage holin family protein [Rhodothermales bacterium]